MERSKDCRNGLKTRQVLGRSGVRYNRDVSDPAHTFKHLFVKEIDTSTGQSGPGRQGFNDLMSTCAGSKVGERG